MKNVHPTQLKKCIFFIEDEFKELMEKLNISIELDFDGNDFVEFTDENEAFETLANYFDVKEITSVHYDDYEYRGIWIVYKD